MKSATYSSDPPKVTVTSADPVRKAGSAPTGFGDAPGQAGFRVEPELLSLIVMGVASDWATVGITDTCMDVLRFIGDLERQSAGCAAPAFAEAREIVKRGLLKIIAASQVVTAEQLARGMGLAGESIELTKKKLEADTKGLASETLK